MVDAPGAYRWSSYRATAGLDSCPAWLTASELLERFDREDPRRATSAYERFVAAAIGAHTSPWDHVVGQIYLGGEGFAERMQRRINERLPITIEHPRPQRFPAVTTLENVRRVVLPQSLLRSNRHRLAFVLLAREEALATLTEIGRELGITSSGASYLMQNARQRLHGDTSFAELVQELRLRIRNCQL